MLTPSGYYIEFEKMHLCSPDLSDCPAILECPYVYACPGDTEKSCAGDILQVSKNQSHENVKLS
jgi:hypothetical protein